MIFGRRAFFAYALSNKGEIWWFNNLYREEPPTRKEVQTLLQQEIRNQLLKIHRGDPATILDIIRQTDHIFAYPIYEMPPLENWRTRRVCLIGDAAHATAPHIGQGASLALEDTLVLAKCLRNHVSLETAFARFEHLRKPRVHKIVRQARKIGDAKTRPNPVAAFFRDRFLKHFIGFEKQKMDWVYAYRAGEVEV